MDYDDHFTADHRKQLVQRKLAEYQAEHYDRELRKLSLLSLPGDETQAIAAMEREQADLERGIESMREELVRLQEHDA